jgi:protein ImuA
MDQLSFISAAAALPPAVFPVSARSHLAQQKAEERAQVQALLRGKLWRGDALASTLAGSIPSGFRQLDQELPGGGWPTHCLTELLCGVHGIGEIGLLAQSLQTLARAGRQIILLAPPALPYPEGWARFGIDPAQLLLVRTDRPGDRLWAIEQSLRSASFGALLAWVPNVAPEALRRLQLAAAGANGLSFLFRPLVVQHQASPAPLRLLLEGMEGRTLGVRLLKRRGPVHGTALHLHLPEWRSLNVTATPKPAIRPVPLPAVAAFPLSSFPFSAIPATAGHALDRSGLSLPAARSHPLPFS